MGLVSLAAHPGPHPPGQSPNTPAAVVARGTTAEQRTVVAPLAEIAGAAASLDPPALVVVGDVVALASRLAVNEHVGAAAA